MRGAEVELQWMECERMLVDELRGRIARRGNECFKYAGIRLSTPKGGAQTEPWDHRK